MPRPGDFTSPSLPHPDPGAAPRAVPHVVAWNLTQRCNLACSHCYIAAGPWASRQGEIQGDEFRRITDEILALNDAPMFVLTGGEPLVRRDLEDMAAYATARGATVVVGTNGTGLTARRIATLMEAGVRGVAISVDSLDPARHDRFRHGDGALEQTLQAVDRLRAARLDFVVQTTLTRANRHEIDDLVAWAAETGAVSFNLYFLVRTGRGEELQPLPPAENDAVLRDLVGLQRTYRGQLMIRSKCQPQLMRHVHEMDPESPLLHYETRCPCGVHYARITPDAKLTACPYLPVEAGDLREQSFAEIWEQAPVLQALRTGALGGKCGRCEYRRLCGGCRARAHAEEADLLGPDESCAYEPAGQVPVVEPQREATYGMQAEAGMTWSPAAQERMQRVPSFVRGVVMKRVERWAEERGRRRITVPLLDEVRSNMPVDFSKRLPFFARGERED